MTPARARRAAASPVDAASCGVANPLDPAHDPGLEVARERAAAVPALPAAPLRFSGGGEVRVGTAGWTDATLTHGEVFYPAGASGAEDRLRYYASRFPLVEVDSTYYALPTRSMAELWAMRTPDEFTFDVKANALMTGHPTEVRRLPRPLRDALPASLASKTRIYAKDLPPELLDAIWETFLDALEPLRSSGKLGSVLLQYPRWFLPSRENADALLEAKRRLGDVVGAVEFRNRRWLTGRVAERTLQLLADHDIPLVMVDAPPGMESSMPHTDAVTSRRLAVLRLHGRRTESWEKRNVSVAERFRYLYDRDELAAVVPDVLSAAKHSHQVHVVFNNCYGNYGTTNAIELGAMLEERR